MKLLLTGTAGFTGAHLAAAARRAGHETHSLAADLTNANAVALEVGRIRPTHVVHLAGISAVTHADENAFYQVNLFGTLNLLKALSTLDQPPAKVVLASSANVYGNAGVSPITEDTCPRPVNHYAMSKLAMELMATAHGGRFNMVITRPFNYTGVGHDTRFVIPKIVSHFARRAPEIELGNLDVEREYNDVRTVCDAYLALLEHGVAGETYNLCSGRAVTLGRVISMLKGITGHSLDVRVNPAFVRASEVQRLCGSPAKLEKAIGPLKCPPLEETLRWMLDAQPH